MINFVRNACGKLKAKSLNCARVQYITNKHVIFKALIELMASDFVIDCTTQLELYLSDRLVQRLWWQYLTRTNCFGENYREVKSGIFWVSVVAIDGSVVFAGEPTGKRGFF